DSPPCCRARRILSHSAFWPARPTACRSACRPSPRSRDLRKLLLLCSLLRPVPHPISRLARTGVGSLSISAEYRFLLQQKQVRRIPRTVRGRLPCSTFFFSKS